MLKKFLEIGEVVGTHGIRGELRVLPWCDTVDFFCQFKTLYFLDENKKIEVSSRPHKNIALVKIKGVETVQQADVLRGKIMYIDRNEIDLGDDVFFVQDIIGLKVKDYNSGEEYGVITDVIKTGANDVYQIKSKDNKEYLIPVIDDVVKDTDLESGVVTIVPMKGIFDDED